MWVVALAVVSAATTPRATSYKYKLKDMPCLVFHGGRGTIGEVLHGWVGYLQKLLWATSNLTLPSGQLLAPYILVEEPRVAVDEWGAKEGVRTGMAYNTTGISTYIPISTAGTRLRFVARCPPSDFSYDFRWQPHPWLDTEFMTLRKAVHNSNGDLRQILGTGSCRTQEVLISPLTLFKAANIFQLGGATSMEAELLPEYISSDAALPPIDECAYWFFRRPVVQVEYRREPYTLMDMTCNHWPRANDDMCSSKADLRQIVPMVAAASKALGVRCVYVNLNVGSGGQGRYAGASDEKALDDNALQIFANDTEVTFRVCKKSVGMKSNAAQVHAATAAAVLVAEIGSFWSDLPMALRCSRGLPTVMLEPSKQNVGGVGQVDGGEWHLYCGNSADVAAVKGFTPHPAGGNRLDGARLVTFIRGMPLPVVKPQNNTKQCSSKLHSWGRPDLPWQFRSINRSKQIDLDLIQKLGFIPAEYPKPNDVLQ